MVQAALTKAGYEVELATTGAAAKSLLSELVFELVMLDLGLPDLHGLRVLEVIVAEYPQTRVCIMTAMDDLAAKEAAFELGGDDYIVKPFALEELLMRVKALLRRSKQQLGTTLIFGDTCIFRAAPLVQRAGRRVQLTPLEHRLLLHLVERSGEVVSRSALLDEVWEGAERFPNTVDVHIESLRKKIDTPFKRKSIRTAYRQGYYFEP
jgi:two-component system copper resistance phosphate regulon response regulator CusR